MRKIYLILLGGDFHAKILRVEQYLPHYLSKYTTVHCFEYPQFSKLFSILLKKKPLLEKVSSNLYVFNSFGILPFGRTFPFINRLNHLVSFILFKFIIGSKIKRFNIMSFTPEAVYILSQIKSIKKIYYYVLDNYISLPYWRNNFQKKQFLSLEKKMLKLANKVITVSSPLYEKYKKLHNNVVYFPTPVELSIYLDYSNNSKLKEDKPIDLKKVPKPIVGFMGAFYDWRIDIKLLLKTLKKYPNVSFAFIGTLEIKNKKMYKTFFFQKNFYYLGYKKLEELPKYVSSFDTCIIPYKVNSYGKSAYPAKINEYLALGKPVVTTGLPALKYLKDKNLIYWTRNSDKFIKNIRIALNEEKDLVLIKRRIEEAKGNGWNVRIKEFIIFLN